MPIPYLYWLFFILLAVLTCPQQLIPGTWTPWAGWLLILVLFGLLGWRVFGSIVK